MTAPDEIQALVESLRSWAKYSLSQDRARDLVEAADALERLSAENARLTELVGEAKETGAALVRTLDQVSADTADIFTMAMHGSHCARRDQPIPAGSRTRKSGC